MEEKSSNVRRKTSKGYKKVERSKLFSGYLLCSLKYIIHDLFVPQISPSVNLGVRN